MALMFIRVTKAAFPKYWPLPWNEVVAATERGDDGLAVAVHRVTEGGYIVIDEIVQRNTAYLKEGETPSWAPNKTLLYQQNW